MPETLNIQTKTEELHALPFDEKIFRNIFNGYVRKFNTIFAVVVILICMPPIAYVIAWYLEQTKVDITSFLRVWHAGESLLLDLGFPHIVFGIFASGIISVGHFSLGVVSVGNFAFGVVSIGGLLSCGVISIGGWYSVGIIALGYSYTYGLISISTGYQQFIGVNQYRGGNAVGFIAIGREARGIYTLSYDERGESTYQFSPKRQDPEAVLLFTQWFRKFKGAFVLPL